MIITIKDKNYDWRGEYREPKPGDIFLNNTGRIIHIGNHPIMNPFGIRAILHPVPVTHLFGGILFEETGEKRSTIFGDWFLNLDGYPDPVHVEPIVYWVGPYNLPMNVWPGAR